MVEDSHVAVLQPVVFHLDQRRTVAVAIPTSTATTLLPTLMDVPSIGTHHIPSTVVLPMAARRVMITSHHRSHVATFATKRVTTLRRALPKIMAISNVVLMTVVTKIAHSPRTMEVIENPRQPHQLPTVNSKIANTNMPTLLVFTMVQRLNLS